MMLLYLTGKHVSIDYVLVGTRCRICVVYVFNLKLETIKERNRGNIEINPIIIYILRENS